MIIRSAHALGNGLLVWLCLLFLMTISSHLSSGVLYAQADKTSAPAALESDGGPIDPNAVVTELGASSSLPVEIHVDGSAIDGPNDYQPVEQPVTPGLFGLNMIATMDFAGIVATEALWGDYDYDADLDLFILGHNEESMPVSIIYRNDRGTFSNIHASLPGLSLGSAAWADYDQDDDLDLLLSGQDSLGQTVTSLFRNDHGAFTDAAIGLKALYRGQVAWGDYDNDGDLDILISGQDEDFYRSTHLYQNEQGKFSEIDAGMFMECACALAWGDYDSDSDLDILLVGRGNYDLVAQILRNELGYFNPLPSSLPLIKALGRAAWGDYDQDGDLDLVLTGLSVQNRPLARIYRNDNGSFTDINAPLHDVWGGDLAWGDYDNDGDLDLVLTGDLNSGELDLVLPGNVQKQIPLVRLYRNDYGSFTEVNAGLPNLYPGTAAWGDVDGDSDLDLLLSGHDQEGRAVTQLWSNLATYPNQVPGVPTGLADAVTNGQVDLNWSAAPDVETPDNGLSYNLAIRSVKAVDDETQGLSTDGLIGYQSATVEAGRYRSGVPGQLRLGPGHYAWSVQAVDTAYAQSAWSREKYFVIEPDLMVETRVEPATPVVGELMTVTLHFANVGNYPVAAAILTTTLPMDVSKFLVTTEIDQGTELSSTLETPLVWRIQNLNAGAGGRIQMVGKAGQIIEAGSIYGTVANGLDSSLDEANLSNNRSVATLTIHAVPELSRWIQLKQMLPAKVLARMGNPLLRISLVIALGFIPVAWVGYRKRESLRARWSTIRLPKPAGVWGYALKIKQFISSKEESVVITPSAAAPLRAPLLGEPETKPSVVFSFQVRAEERLPGRLLDGQ